MSPKSRGKKFESEIYQMLKHHPRIAFFQRWPDIGLSNPVDFTGCLRGGRYFALECKSISKKSLPYSSFVNKKDRFNGDTYGRQWRTLERLYSAGAAVYVLVNFYGWAGRDGMRGRAWAVPLGWLAEYRTSHARKSVPPGAIEKDCVELVKVRGAWEWGELEP